MAGQDISWEEDDERDYSSTWHREAKAPERLHRKRSDPGARYERDYASPSQRSEQWESSGKYLHPDRAKAEYSSGNVSDSHSKKSKHQRSKSSSNEKHPYQEFTKTPSSEAKKFEAADFERYETKNVQAERMRLYHDDCLFTLDGIAKACTSLLRKDSNTRNSPVRGVEKQVHDVEFRLRSWGTQVNISYLQDTLFRPVETAERVSKTLQRLTSHLKALQTLFDMASPKDFDKQPEDTYEDETSSDDDGVDEHITIDKIKLSIGSEIRDKLSAINSMTRTLGVLSRPLQFSVAPNPLRRAVTSIVTEGHKYFGSTEALRRYSVDERLFGEEALYAAREKADASLVVGAMGKLRIQDDPLPSLERRRSRGERSGKYERRPSPSAPVLVRTHRKHLSEETLKFFDIEWTVDPADPDYLIILRELDMSEMGMLFEHTRRLRMQEREADSSKRTSPRNQPVYTFVRKRAKGEKAEKPQQSASSSSGAKQAKQTLG